MKTKKMNYANLNNSKFVNVSKTVLTLLLVAIFGLTSCKSDENDQEGQDPDGAALGQMFQDNRTNNTQTFMIDASTGGTVTGSQGTQVTFPANSIGLNGVAVTGNVDIELVEVYDRASMLLNNMPTSGKKPNGDEEALKSAGEYFINATQNGTDLDLLAPAQVQSRGVGSNVPEAMNIFRAGDNVEDLDLWEEADEDGDGITDVGGMGERETANGFEFFYLFDISSFGWANLDRWYNYTGALTDISIDVPDVFHGTNCEVYLTYDGEPTALARMDIYDAQTGLFTEHYGRIPVGQEVHIILVAEIGGVLHSTIQGTTIVDNHVETMAYPQATTQAALTTAINGLP
ncbi:MAG: hypothetical protein V3U80_09330 [Flavobacteriaceae bacterium]